MGCGCENKIERNYPSGYVNKSLHHPESLEQYNCAQITVADRQLLSEIDWTARFQRSFSRTKIISPSRVCSQNLSIQGPDIIQTNSGALSQGQYQVSVYDSGSYVPIPQGLLDTCKIQWYLTGHGLDPSTGSEITILTGSSQSGFINFISSEGLNDGYQGYLENFSGTNVLLETGLSCRTVLLTVEITDCNVPGYNRCVIHKEVQLNSPNCTTTYPPNCLRGVLVNGVLYQFDNIPEIPCGEPTTIEILGIQQSIQYFYIQGHAISPPSWGTIVHGKTPAGLNHPFRFIVTPARFSEHPMTLTSRRALRICFNIEFSGLFGCPSFNPSGTSFTVCLKVPVVCSNIIGPKNPPLRGTRPGTF